MMTSNEYQERTAAEIVEMEMREQEINVEVSRLLGICGDIAKVLRALRAARESE